MAKKIGQKLRYLRKLELIVFFEVGGVGLDEIVGRNVLDRVEFEGLGGEH